MNFLLRSCVPLICFSMFSTVAHGAPIVPAGLNPGDEYHLVFVTDATRDATSTDIAVYNSFVQGEAALNPSITGTDSGVTYNAIASTSAIAGSVNAPVTAPVYLLDGTKVADGFADMWDATIQAPIDVDQYLASGNCCDVWTGTTIFGAIQVPLGDANPINGHSLQSTSGWVAAAPRPQANSSQLYGLSSKITVAFPTPEPSTAALLLLGTLGLICRRCRH